MLAPSTGLTEKQLVVLELIKRANEAGTLIGAGELAKQIPWKASRPAMVYIVNYLEEKGCLIRTVETVHGGRGRPRVYFEVTGTGREYLKIQRGSKPRKSPGSAGWRTEQLDETLLSLEDLALEVEELTT